MVFHLFSWKIQKLKFVFLALDKRVVSCCKFLSSIFFTLVDVEEERRLVQDFGKDPPVEQTGFTTAFRVSKQV